jgi:polyhydroxyalkanoate synthesis repressor PhaR
MNKKILIKKYENRRLYDVTHSRYVNLDEIARAVQDEYDVQVLDASTGEDITRFVMTQIITEHAKAPDSVFPLDILRQMVVASGKASQENAFNYMRAVAEMYKHALRGISKTTMSPFEVMQSLIQPGAPGSAEMSSDEQPSDADMQFPAPPSQDAQENAEIQELKRRIHELEDMVADMHRASARKKKKDTGAPAAKGRAQ